MDKNIVKLLEKAANLKQNVLLSGKHGVGKTAVIKKIFTERYGNNWLYFSASTMDPWVDFVGIPKEVSDEKGHFLELVKPKCLRDNTVRAIFFDEFNRAAKKVKNAVMELMQFKSINGHKFDNLEMIWAAINPQDEQETYDVERIDPAQLDRFQVHIDIPYSPEISYFAEKYGKAGENAVRWWKKLTPENKEMVSPRRLDYALNLIQNNFPVADYVINKKCGPQTLVKFINEEDNCSLFQKAIDTNDIATATKMINSPIILSEIQKLVKDNIEFVNKLKKNKEVEAIIGPAKNQISPAMLKRAKNVKLMFGSNGKKLFNDPNLHVFNYLDKQRKHGISRCLNYKASAEESRLANGNRREAFNYFVSVMKQVYETN